MLIIFLQWLQAGFHGNIKNNGRVQVIRLEHKRPLVQRWLEVIFMLIVFFAWPEYPSPSYCTWNRSPLCSTLCNWTQGEHVPDAPLAPPLPSHTWFLAAKEWVIDGNWRPFLRWHLKINLTKEQDKRQDKTLGDFLCIPTLNTGQLNPLFHLCRI